MRENSGTSGTGNRLLTACVLVLLAGALAGVAPAACAQGSKADYERAASFDERTRNRVFRSHVEPHWFDKARRFWYRIQSGRDQFEFVLVDAEQGRREPAFDHARLAEQLSAASGRPASGARLPFQTLTFDDALKHVSFSAFGKTWRCDLQTYAIVDVAEEPADDPNGSFSGVNVLEQLQRSERNGEETSVRFVNRTDSVVRLYWIDTSGRRVIYDRIGAGKHHDQHTFAGHVWLVSDGDDRPLVGVRATSREGTVVLDGQRLLQDARVARRRGSSQRRRRNARSRSISPDGKWDAVIQNHNVVLQARGDAVPEGAAPKDAASEGEASEAATDDELRSWVLSESGTADDPFAPQFSWSPDSRYLAVMQIRADTPRQIHFIESSPDDQLQPKLHTLEYHKPGDRMPVPRPRLFDVAERRQIDVADELFPNAWSIRDLRWADDSSRFSFLYNQRGHQVLRFVDVNAQTGATRAIIEETSETFIDYANKQFAHRVEGSDEMIWMSERDGWNHLYLYDAASGQLKNQITSGQWVVRGVERVDDEKRQIWFRAGGIHPKQDPYHVHLARVDFDGRNLTLLTRGDGTHEWEFSPERRYLICTHSRVDQPPITELRRSADGELVCELERADWSELLATGWKPPQRFASAGRDGRTEIYGILVRPTHFEPGQTYPVIEKIYAGPHDSFVPKSFGVQSSLYALAELGFIVVQIDGMGTSNRSKAFHDVCYKNLVDAGFPDRIRWMRAAAAAHPEMDLTRVGIYGGSAGGQNALAGLLTHGEFYKVGVADCGCHDNRMDKIWWNELWMGWPIGPHYEAQSNVTLAHRLEGKLLLTVGELDRNVDPASTMQVVKALIEADKDFELLVMPGVGHGAGERPYARRRRADFFVRHLLDVEPRWDKPAQTD